jgi:two-component system response regulator FlrC
MTKLPVLIVEDDHDLLEALCATLKLAGYETLFAESGAAALSILKKQIVGLVVSDVQMKNMDGFALLREIKTLNPAIPVLLMTAHGDVERAVAAMRAGACDYLLKPFESESLVSNVARYLLPTIEKDTDGVVAKDPRTSALLSLAKRVAQSSATIMLTGESGCGKEVVARFIHRQSPRSEQPFIAINCAAIPDHLLEATLFGYEKGAFTGASQSQPGKFEQAQGGTLLLDEISEMPLALQAKLLRVLQEREVERVGGRKAIPLDIRLIATSNRDMAAMVAKGGFREDLYYRLNVFPIVIPPLRERPMDIVPMAQRILDVNDGRADKSALQLSGEAAARLMQHNWPGNVRELENVIQRAMILALADVIEIEDLNLPLIEAAEELVEIVVKQKNDLGSSLNEDADTDTDESQMDMKSLEKAHIIETLNAVNGSRKLAVKRLGISERTLRYKLQQYRLTETEH